jgi:hypothetical protein
MGDFTLECPHCDHTLECPTDIAGASVNCPLCGGEFIVPEPPEAEQLARVHAERWMINTRILVRGAPPSYLKVLIEAPKSWLMPEEGYLSEPAIEAITRTVHTKFPENPITPMRICAAEGAALRRCSDETDYSDECCKAWLFGRPTSSPS